MPSFTAAQAHGEIQALFPNVFFVIGSVGLPGPLPMRFSRNMIIVREGERLILVNSVRLSEAGLAALDQLGKVTDVMRLAGNHGMDDPFYADRYGAKVWAVRGQRYTSGLDTSISGDLLHGERWEWTRDHPAADRRRALAPHPVDAARGLPRLAGRRRHRDRRRLAAELGSRGRILQLARAHRHAPHGLHQAGQRRAGVVEAAQAAQGRPPRAARATLRTTLLPAHGAPVLGNARERYRAAIERAVALTARAAE